LSIQDGNFGDTSIRDLIEKAEEEDDIHVLVASVGDEESNRNVLAVAGEERAIIPASISDLPEMAGDKILDVLADRFPEGEEYAYFNEKKALDIDPQIREIFENNQLDRFSFLQGTKAHGKSSDGETGELFSHLDPQTSQQYQNLILQAFKTLCTDFPELSKYDIVLLKEVDFSGHFGVSRKRIYIPVEILEIALNPPGPSENLIRDFILHHYIENLFKRHERDLEIEVAEKTLISAVKLQGNDETLSIHDKIIQYLAENDRDAGRLDKNGRSIYEQVYILYSERLRRTGYRHFYYQTKNNKEFLIFRKVLRSGRIIEYKWERGAGGKYVPDIITVDNDYNEAQILQMFELMYQQGVEYTSYSQDGRYYLREGAEGKTTLVKREKNGRWIDSAELNFDPVDTEPSNVVE